MSDRLLVATRKGLVDIRLTRKRWEIAKRSVQRPGERLTFGSTTGSVWVSENSGDNWRTVSKHLPPIYVMRFAS